MRGFISFVSIVLLSLPLVHCSVEDIDRTFEQIVTAHGYSVESHQVITEDGYILGIFRIPGKIQEVSNQSSSQKQSKPPVLLWHGIFDQCTSWVCNDNQSPAFLLVDAGYDVWLGNARGNLHSRNHVKWNPNKDMEFWRFSWQEIGQYDVKAVTDYIISNTKWEKIAYVGHSMGNTQIFSAMSDDPEFFRKRWSFYVALAPPIYATNLQSPILLAISDKFNYFYLLCKLLGFEEVFNANFVTTNFVKVLCETFPTLCNYGSTQFSDEDSSNTDETAMKVHMAHWPAGASLDTMWHFRQLYTHQRFEKFDYGEKANLIKYGSVLPEEIDIKKMIGVVKIAIAVGTQDLLADCIDDERVYQEIKETVVFYKEYNIGHGTFILAKDMSYFTEDIIPLIDKYHHQKA